MIYEIAAWLTLIIAALYFFYLNGLTWYTVLLVIFSVVAGYMMMNLAIEAWRRG